MVSLAVFLGDVLICLTLSFDDEEVFCNQQGIGAMWTGCSLGSSGLKSVILLRGPDPSDTGGHF